MIVAATTAVPPLGGLGGLFPFIITQNTQNAQIFLV